MISVADIRPVAKTSPCRLPPSSPHSSLLPSHLPPLSPLFPSHPASFACRRSQRARSVCVRPPYGEAHCRRQITDQLHNRPPPQQPSDYPTTGHSTDSNRITLNTRYHLGITLNARYHLADEQERCRNRSRRR